MSTALPLLAVFAFNSVLVLTAILLHYEVLYQLARRLPEVGITPRYRVLLGVGVIFIAHVIEIWLFALGYLISLRVEGIGGLVGEPSGHGALMDYAYLSSSPSPPSVMVILWPMDICAISRAWKRSPA